MNKDNNFQQGLGMAMRVGVEMTVATLIGAVMGYALDNYLGTRPWLLLVGVLLGGAAGCLTVYRTVTNLSTDEEIEEDDEKNRKDEKDI